LSQNNLAVVGLLLGLTCIPATGEEGRLDLLITGARVVVGDGTMLEKASVGIASDRIQYLGTEDTQPEADRVIDGSGFTILPGLIDAHVHLIDPEYARDEYSLQSYMSVTLPHWLNGMLLHGVTTVRSLGDPIAESLEIKGKVASGRVLGPRVIASGPGLTSPKGHPAVTMFNHYPDMQKRFVRVASNADEARAVVHELVSSGMNSPLKLVFHGGIQDGKPYEFMGTPIVRLSLEVLREAIRETHKLGYRITVHTFDYDEALTAVLAGVDGLEHGVVTAPMPDNRLIHAMLENETAVVSTLRLHAKSGSEFLSIAIENVKRFHGAGIPIVAGSDTPVGWTYPGLDTLYEIELLVTAGLSPMEAIQAATGNAARYLELDDELGTVHEGKLADLLIVRGNPLENISLLRSPGYVIKSGLIIRGLDSSIY
jgi:imidazolonepropionase-like amidohydrolase